MFEKSQRCGLRRANDPVIGYLAAAGSDLSHRSGPMLVFEPIAMGKLATPNDSYPISLCS